MKKALNILLAEYAPKWCDKSANLEYVESTIATMPEGVDLVVLPEMFSTGFITDDHEAIEQLAEKNTGDTIHRLQQLASKYGVGIAGTFLARTLNRFYNRAFFIEPSGDSVYYDKHHLFSMGGEAKEYTAGETTPPIIRYLGWNILPVVCYEVRFPEWIRNIGNKYDLMLVYANWPKARKQAWETLLMARALENQCYVVGVNRCGEALGIEYPQGSSKALTARGENIAVKYGDSYVAVLDYEKLERFRDKFPVWKDATDFTLHI